MRPLHRSARLASLFLTESQRPTQGPGAESGAGPGSESAPPPRSRGRASRLLRIEWLEASRPRSRERKMAAPAGGGGSAVSVLAPNGRRHTVKVTPSTVLLQVRPPARVGDGRAGGRGEGGGPEAAAPGPPLRLLPGPWGGAGPWWAVLEAANERLSRGCPPHSASAAPMLGRGRGRGPGRGGTAGGAFSERPAVWGPRWQGGRCGWRPGVFDARPNPAFSVTGKSRGAPRTLGRPCRCVRK